MFEPIDSKVSAALGNIANAVEIRLKEAQALDEKFKAVYYEYLARNGKNPDEWRIQRIGDEGEYVLIKDETPPPQVGEPVVEAAAEPADNVVPLRSRKRSKKTDEE